MTCRHTEIEPDSYDDRFRGCVVERWRCRQCKETVGMGRSPEKPTRVEIAAAAIAAEWEDGGSHSDLTPAEHVGYRLGGGRYAGTLGWYAGWLARAIVEHDTQCDECDGRCPAGTCARMVESMRWCERAEHGYGCVAPCPAAADEVPIATGADHIGLTPRQVRDRQVEADRVEDALRGFVAAAPVSGLIADFSTSDEVENQATTEHAADDNTRHDVAASVARHAEIEATPSGFVPWPADQPPRYNGSGTPCDMWIGPCSCGATHLKTERAPDISDLVDSPEAFDLKTAGGGS